MKKSAPRSILSMSPRQLDIIAVLLSAFAFYLNSACVSYAAQHTRATPGFFVVSRSLIGALLTPLVIMIVFGKPAKPKKVKSLCLRGLANFLALLTFFEATARLGPALGNLLNLTYPIFLALFSIFDPLERNRIRSTIISTTVAFAGMALVLQPTSGADTDLAGVLVGLLSGAIGAIAVASLKSARSSNSPGTILTFLFAISLPLSLVCFWQEIFVPNLEEFLLLLLGSLAGVAGQYLFALGARHISAAESGIISQSRIVFAAVIGQFLALETALAGSQIIGIALICLINMQLLISKPVKVPTGTVS